MSNVVLWIHDTAKLLRARLFLQNSRTEQSGVHMSLVKQSGMCLDASSGVTAYLHISTVRTFLLHNFSK